MEHSHRSRGESFSFIKENPGVGATNHQGRHAMHRLPERLATDIFSHELSTGWTGPPAGYSHRWSRFSQPSGSHGAAHPRWEERSPCCLPPARKEPIRPVLEFV